MSIQTITWEDPNIEIQVLNEICQRGFTKLEILMPCSSGDTALSLLSNNQVSSVTCVSPNGKELACLELKSELLRKVPDPETRINFIHGNLPEQRMIEILNQLSALQSHHYWLSHQNDVIQGIANLDLWILRFKECQETIRHKILLLIENNINDIPEHEIILSSCQKTFSNKKMLEIISYKMIAQGIDKPICRTIYQTYLNHFEYLDREENIFYQLMCRGEYDRDSYPHYVSEGYLATNFNQRLKLINQNLWRYLSETTRKFAIISVGNLTDYLNKCDLHKFIYLVHLKTMRHGRAIFRRMQSDIPLRPIVNQFFIILEIDRDYTDQTYLYQEVLVGCPRK